MSNYETLDDNILVKKQFRLNRPNCAILDCDGTLININRSYNACIKKTVGFILEQIAGGKEWYDLVSDDLILRFRMSGGFNNDMDTSYACIVSAMVAGSNNIEVAREFASRVAANADENGVSSVEDYLARNGHAGVVKKAKQLLNYPGLVGSSMLATVFDEFFYGRDLFVRRHGIQPKYDDAKGFIDNDDVVISGESAAEISRIFNGNVAIVSGRSRLATEYSLQPLLHNFNLVASVFLEDEEKEVMKNNPNTKVSKPEPYALLKAMKTMNAASAISVGDSVEDLIMSSRAGKEYHVIFCGVYGTGIDSDKQLRIFTEMGADAIIENINLLPRLLRLLEH